MKLKMGAVLGVALAVACAAAALADNYSVKDASGTVQTFGSKLINGVQYQAHMLYVLFGGSPVPVNGDASGNLGVNVQSSALPAGAATAANQTATQANAGSDASKAISVQGITGGTPLPTKSYQPTTTTDRSITVTTGGTAQQVMALNTSRRSFYVFNPNTSGTCWGSFTTTTPAANALGSFPVPALGAFGMENNATTAALYVNCPTTGQFMTAWESQ